MAETLGSLCDKLTIVKLKRWHTEDSEKQKSLSTQEENLKLEIDEYISAAHQGLIPVERLTFYSNKVHKNHSDYQLKVQGTIGEMVSRLAEANCALWHEQEKVYDFENVPSEQKDKLVKHLAVLNLDRTKCIDEIDRQFQKKVMSAQSNEGGR